VLVYRSTKGQKRKLAAILAADVVGFSRLTGVDEDRTLARLRALRSDLIDPTISVHNGRVFKRTGDGALRAERRLCGELRYVECTGLAAGLGRATRTPTVAESIALRREVQALARMARKTIAAIG
jgi:class 3 adenylate cyclase